jgi:hypothetical protein
MRPISIFFSYAHEDTDLMNLVRRQLVRFEREGMIIKKYDRLIKPGQEWEGIIDADLNNSNVILLFISPHFMESKYCYNTEMRVALERHEKGEAAVIPIILRPCIWQDAQIGKLQALPAEGKPVTKWGNRDEAALNVAEGIMSVVREMSDGVKKN